ncbi:hypothetical protein [Methylomicrobium lacus]|uniref:hypothetical protein n=1 Tax=Methylomicrobium lacus TaxID=136992 RepID=UPI0035A908A2
MNQLKRHGLLIVGLTSAFVAQAETQWVTVAKSNESIQCESAGISPKTMKKELTEAKIPAKHARCGTDGMLYSAVCGAETGRLNLFDIPAKKLGDASELGFQPLGDWPDASEAPCEEEVAFEGNAAEISITGIGPAVDGKAYRKVLKTIGNAVADNVISRFIVYGYGVEGGFSGCVQEGRFAQPNAFSDVIKKLRAINADPSTTAYSVTAVDKCETSAPEINGVE